MSEPGQAILDRWSLAHLAAGLLLGALAVPWTIAVGLVVAWEVAEAGLRRYRTGVGIFESESWGNLLADIAIGMGGWALAAWLRSS